MENKPPSGADTSKEKRDAKIKTEVSPHYMPTSPKLKTAPQEAVDGATACANVAHFMTEISFIFPISPSSPMSESYDVFCSKKRLNMFGVENKLRQMQSEAGVAGALHGALLAGNMATTFTASQGLLLMIPNMYKIAGELLPCVIHIAARTIAQHALSIFGDHSDLYAVRVTGWAILAGSSVQEAQDLALVSHLATLRARIPFIHSMDGYRISHEVNKIEMLDWTKVRDLVDEQALETFRSLAMDSEHPDQRGTAQGPEVYFQQREGCTPYYAAVPGIVEEVMNQVAQVTGRHYSLFEYHGAEDAEDVIVIMGSAAEVVKEYLDFLYGEGMGLTSENVEMKQEMAKRKLGVITVKLYRPFSNEHFLKAMPRTVKRVAVLDRVKETSGNGEPLYMDVLACLKQFGLHDIMVIGGRYGLSSRDFTPQMCHAVYHNLLQERPKTSFTVGIIDDVSNSSLDIPTLGLDTAPAGTTQCVFWGLGSDGTVSANKIAIKIIGKTTDMYSQGFFVYDANKFGSLTNSHLRFGKYPVKAPYLIENADFIACSQFNYVFRYPLLKNLKQNGVFLLNSEYTNVEDLTKNLPAELKNMIAKKKARFYVIDAGKIAQECHLGGKTNQILQTAFFRLTQVIPIEQAVENLKHDVVASYGKKGEQIVKRNFDAIEMTLDPNVLIEIAYPESWAQETTGGHRLGEWPEEKKDSFIKEVFEPMTSARGEDVPTSKLAPDGRMVTGTNKFAKRGLATMVPHWNDETCIQCNRCNISCPHAVIRPFLLTDEEVEQHRKENPEFKVQKSKVREGMNFKIQMSPLDCTGCEVCCTACPVPNTLWMEPIKKELAAGEKENWDYLSTLPHHHGTEIPQENHMTAGYQMPLFEFHGACAGCGETPIIRYVTQLFGQRMLIANATGCSTIYGGSYPMNPYTSHPETKRGPAWANSLYEDNAEFGFGIAMTQRNRRDIMRVHVNKVLQDTVSLPGELRDLLTRWQTNWKNGDETIKLHDEMKGLLDVYREQFDADDDLRYIRSNLTDLIKKSIWILGGDGWAYDIGFGGVDHILQSGEDFNILIVDTEVYSNTGGQRSKATPLGAMAKFAASGKETPKKDIGLIAMSYGTAYVGSVALGYDMEHAYKTLKEAEAYEGPSIVIAYTPCIEHGYFDSMKVSFLTQKLAVQCGYWIVYRYNPALAEHNMNPFSLDCPPMSKHPKEFLDSQARYKSLSQNFPERAEQLHKELMKSLPERRRKYVRMQYNWEYEKPEVQEAIERGILKVGSEALQNIRESLEKPAEGRKGRKAKPKIKPLWVVYATETGNSKAAAEAFCQELKTQLIEHELKPTSSIKPEDLQKCGLAVIIMSSTGVGDMPSMAEPFHQSLLSTTQGALSGLKFIMFGLGDPKFRSSYLGAPKKMKQALEAAGATSLMDMGEGSDMDPQGYKTGYAVWKTKAVETIKQAKASESRGLPEEEEEEESLSPTRRRRHKHKERAQILVGYGSGGGKATSVASYVANQLTSITGNPVMCRSLAELKPSDLATVQVFVCVSSSAGLGDVPENAKEFLKSLQQASPGSLSHMYIAMFGIGDPSFKQWYLGGAKLLLDAFTQAGAQPLVPMGQGNDKDKEGPFTALGTWLPLVVTALGYGDTAEYEEPTEIPIVYCTGTGKAQKIAEQIAAAMSEAGLKNKVMGTNEMSPRELSSHKYVIMVISSVAVGEIPGMGEKFYDDLLNMQPGSLKHLRLAMFGLGDPSFKDYYMAGPKTMLQAFEAAGATLALPLGQGSDRDSEGHQTGLRAWLPELLTMVTPVQRVKEHKPKPKTKTVRIASSPDQTIDVLYASGSGKSKIAAQKVSDNLNAAFKETGTRAHALGPKPMDQVTLSDLKSMRVVLFVLSSVGLGDVPAMGDKLYRQIKECEPNYLSHLKFAVFGLGDPSFKEWYQGGPRKLVSALTAAGAWALVPLGAGSDKDADGYNTALDMWLPGLADMLRAPAAPVSESERQTPQPTTSAAHPAKTEAKTGVEKAVVRVMPPSEQPKPASPEKAKAKEEPRKPAIATPVKHEPYKPVTDEDVSFIPRTEAMQTPWNHGDEWTYTLMDHLEEHKPNDKVEPPQFNRPIFHGAPAPGTLQIQAQPLKPEQRDPNKRLVEGVYIVTCLDWNIRNFHGYETKDGSTYGSYLLLDECVTLIDSVKYPFATQLLENISRLVPLDKLKYIVVNHAEPDHSSSIPFVIAACPEIEVVCNDKCKKALEKIYPTEGWKFKVVQDGEVLEIGKRRLRFVTVPLCHWPESMWTYEETQKVLYSNDGFGQHIATERLWDDEHALEDVMKANRAYYANILAPYNTQIKRALDKARDLDIAVIATAHGVCWRSYIPQVIESYKNWSHGMYLPRVIIAYDTMYAATEMMAQAVSEGVRSIGVDVRLLNARATHITYMATDLLEAAGVCIGSSIINGQLLPTMESAIGYMSGFSAYERLGLVFGSYGWQGPVLEDLLNRSADRLNLKRTRNAIIVNYTPTEEVLQECWTAGRDMALAVLKLVKEQRST